MTAHDDDILDFDFVDDETRELAAPAVRPGPRQPPPGDAQRGGRGPRGPQLGAHGLTPLLRLAVVVCALVCRPAGRWGAGVRRRGRADDVQRLPRLMSTPSGRTPPRSAPTGPLLTTPGLAQAELETRLGGLVQQQELDVSRARDLDSPGPLTPSHAYAVQSLELRVAGLQGMLDVFRATKDSEDAAAAGRQLASMGQRLEASDVVWKDLFQPTATEATTTEGVQGLTAPASVFVQNTDLYTPRSLSSIWQRVHGASTGGTPGGLHGSQLAFTEVQPAGVQLTTSTEHEDHDLDRPRVRGGRQQLGREPGGRRQGQADDPGPAQPDRANGRG